MSGEDKNKEKENRFSAFENFSFKKMFKYNMWILLLLFLFIGVGSIYFLSQEGAKLAGGGELKYNELSSNTKAQRFSLIEKVKYFFTNIKDEVFARKDGRYAEGNKNEEETESNIKGDVDFKTNREIDDNSRGDGRGHSNPYYASSLRSKSPSSSLTPSLSSPESYLSGGQSMTSLSSFDNHSKSDVKLSQSNSKAVKANLTKNNSTSALSLLKSTYKASLYAARDASNDTARAWTAKAFDLSPDVSTTLEYNEKLRAKLDRINPNSIPAFLKDPSLDSESMRSLKESDVPGFSTEKDEESDKDKLIDDLKSQIDSLKEKMKESNSLPLNPMLNINSNSTESENSSEKQNSSDIVENPQNPPTLGENTGEYAPPATDEYKRETVKILVNGEEVEAVKISQGNETVGYEIPPSGSFGGMCALPQAVKEENGKLVFNISS